MWSKIGALINSNIQTFRFRRNSVPDTAEYSVVCSKISGWNLDLPFLKKLTSFSRDKSKFESFSPLKLAKLNFHY